MNQGVVILLTREEAEERGIKFYFNAGDFGKIVDLQQELQHLGLDTTIYITEHAPPFQGLYYYTPADKNYDPGDWTFSINR